jgi:hypothetical protein
MAGRIPQLHMAAMTHGSLFGHLIRVEPVVQPASNLLGRFFCVRDAAP